MDTIESVQHDIRAWRRRQPRGALPAALRSRILALGSQLDSPGAHRALGVHASTLYRWREQARSSKGFVELRPEPRTAAHEPGLRLEISRPDGTHLRFVGLDLEDVANLLVRLQAAR
jgi:hypothetical protein